MNDYDSINPEDVGAVKNGEATHQGFPHIPFAAAITKDIVDIASLGTIGIFANIVIAPIIYSYVNSNMGATKRKLYRKFIRKMIGEFIPVWSAFSFWTFFVWRAYKEISHKE
ncbi:MAG: hypothetical protein HY452_02490 [Parcubacteria group bacterium]|nr:hypothetical protein [Parcubacteria group bacterium]